MPATEKKKDRQPPWEDQSGRDQITFGTWLRRQREIREIPLREIADVTKISLRYLEALEQDRFDVLPAPVFARGFLREYSKYVGLDPDEVVNSYLTADRDTAEAEVGSGSERIGQSSSSSSRMPLIVAVVALVALLGLIYAAARFLPRSDEERQPPPMAAPVVAPPVPAAGVTDNVTVGEAPGSQPEPAIPIVMTMDFTEDCWVEVEVDGERRLSELHVQGESMRLEAEQAIRLTLGNPKGVHLEVNGKVHGLDFARGRVVRDVLIDLDLVQALESGAE
ncbi:MAG: helix-turn-helix domain-containing protein [Acidobacteriota bacterium]|nr:helix-turn-helix domain-containing protein [Acidobacteriota bacterium]